MDLAMASCSDMPSLMTEVKMDPAGSASITLTSGFCSLRTLRSATPSRNLSHLDHHHAESRAGSLLGGRDLPVPLIVPPVEPPATKWVTEPEVCLQISGPRVR